LIFGSLIVNLFDPAQTLIISLRFYPAADGYRRRVFFNYEKRIRLQSPPEKVINLVNMSLFNFQQAPFLVPLFCKLLRWNF
jgi:hypothetical protein